MKIILEVFYMRIQANRVCYLRKQIHLSRSRGDPDTLLKSLLQQKLQTSAGVVEQEFMVHSTSWRYAAGGRIVLTYVAYSDELEFGRGRVKNITLKQLRKINISSGQPRSREGRERQVVAHAMRHISFLIKTDTRNEFANAFTPSTRKVFKSLWVSLAGRLTF
jgi:hypothetical protein